MGGHGPEPARSPLAAGEMFAMITSSGTRVAIAKKIIDGTPVSLGRDGHGSARAYDMAVASAAGSSGDGADGWAVHAAGGTSHGIDGLDPYSDYEICVGGERRSLAAELGARVCLCRGGCGGRQMRHSGERRLARYMARFLGGRAPAGRGCLPG